MHRNNLRHVFPLGALALVVVLLFTHAGGAAEALSEAERQRYEAMADTFIQTQDWHNAMLVIRKVLDREPSRPEWKIRLARLLEWSGDPSAAYKIWKEVAATGNQEATSAVSRLAQSVGDSGAHLALLQQTMRRGGMKAADITALAQAYEYYGRVEEGIAFFQSVYAAGGNPDVLSVMAFLHEQRGDVQEALRLHREHLDRFGFDLDRSVRIADLLFLQGRWRDAYGVLHAMADRDIPASHRFWDLYADMAWELQHQEEAERGYRVILSRKEFSVSAAERLGFLALRTSPQAAAAILLDAYHVKEDIKLLTLGLQYCVTARAFDVARKEIDLLPPERRKQYEQDNSFAMIAGLVSSSLKRYDEALRLYRLVLQRIPDDPAAREAILWVLIEQRRLKPLARVLGAWQDDLLAAGRHYLVLASAYSALNRFDQARRYYFLYLRSMPDDLMLRLTHAEMFDQISRPDIQTRLKSDLFRTVMQRYQNGTLRPGTTDNDILLGQLALAFMPNSRLAGYFEQVRKRNEAAVRPDYALHELWLTWAINSGHEEAALRMMRRWETSATPDANPFWGKLLLALKQKDIDAAGTMLDRDYRLLPRWDRIDAAREARQYHEAQDMAFETMSAPNNDRDHETHERFTNLVTQSWNQMDLRVQYDKRDLFHDVEIRSAYLFRVASDWWLQPWASTTRYTARDGGQLNLGHLTDRRLGLHLLKKSPKLDADMSIYTRDAWKSFVAAELSVTKHYNEAFSMTAAVGRNAATDVSEVLLAAGMRDYARAEATYAFSFREFLTAAVTAERLMLQDRSSLGSAVRYELVFGHRVRIEYPDITIRVPLQYYKTSPKSLLPASVAGLVPNVEDLAADYFVPKSSRQVGIGVDYGVSVRETYTKAWRPFVSVDYTYNDVTHASASMTVGIAGSIEGRDHMVISAGRGFGKGFAKPSNEIIVHYTFNF